MQSTAKDKDSLIFAQLPQEGSMWASCSGACLGKPLLASLMSSKEESHRWLDKKCRAPSIVNLYESPLSTLAVITRWPCFREKANAKEGGSRGWERSPCLSDSSNVQRGAKRRHASAKEAGFVLNVTLGDHLLAFSFFIFISETFSLWYFI